MPYMHNSSYREIPFCAETPHHDFYTYVDLKDVSDKCENHLGEIVRCRTIGILQSLNGRYYLTDFDSSGVDSTALVQISVVYLQLPPPSTVIPYPVQIFGSLQWHNRPVIFAKILQVLCVPTAVRLMNALRGITSAHLAKRTSTHNENTAS
ncbi:unnamed protein product [Arctia plantaginis]|uniref:Uncharacterized protein n=1 Tax=Arctia plantaginis TaxID=874455 RepID=A0A8S1B8I4_ARCPL|nr:unnamed protein product [Arctia plantaginis]